MFPLFYTKRMDSKFMLESTSKNFEANPSSTSENSDDEPNYMKKVWRVIDLYFDEYGLVQHQIESFNWFLEKFIPNYIENLPEIVMNDQYKKIDHTIRFTDFHMKHPLIIEQHDVTTHRLTPSECRDRNLSYRSPSYINIIHKKQTPEGTTTNIIKEVFIGHIPIMIKSNNCILHGKNEAELIALGESPAEHGGYTVLNGGEKVIVAQEKISPNYVHVFSKGDDTKAEIRSANEMGKQTTIYVKWMVNKRWGKVVRLSLPFIKQDIPMVVVFRALGCLTEKEIYDYILLGEEDPELRQMLLPSFQEGDSIGDQESALLYIAQNSNSGMGKTDAESCVRSKSYLEKEFYPHIDAGPMWEIRKCFFLGHMIKKLLKVVINPDSADDRDHYANKRVDIAGHLLSSLFQDRFKKMVSDLRSYLHNSIDKGNEIDLRQGIKAKYITTGLAAALKTGNWNPNKHTSSKGGGGGKSGVAQVLSRLTHISTLSHLRRLNTPSAKEGNNPKPRQLHNTHFAYNCVYETPEGGSCVTLDTLILTPSGQQEIRYLKNGDTVWTYNIKNGNMELSSIDNYFNIKKEVFETNILGGWSVKATGDHPFFTRKGWTNLEDLEINDEVFVKRVLKNFDHTVAEQKIILDEQHVSEYLTGIGIKDTIISKNIQKLKDKGLLPLKNTSNFLPVLARMVGYLFADGSITLSKKTAISTICFGLTPDVEEFERDVEYLGFKSKTSRYRTTSYKSKTGRIITQNTYVVSHGGALCMLFLSLGVPFSKKTRQPFSVPSWVNEGSMLVKREFLSGFQGGDGGSITYHKRKGKKNVYNIALIGTSLHKYGKNVENLKIFMKNIVSLMKELNYHPLKIVTTEEEPGYFSVRINYSKEISSILHYLETIGYRYAHTKNEKGDKGYCYFRYKKHIWDTRINLKTEIHKNGESPIKLAREKILTSRQLFSLLEQKDSKTLPPRNILNIDDFLDLHFKNGGVFLPIIDKKTLGVQTVADFTTLNDNHSFIANGFVTHNCGLVKNLPLMTQVSIGQSNIYLMDWFHRNNNLISIENEFPEKIAGKFKVFVNGAWVGILPNNHEDYVAEWIDRFKLARRDQEIHKHTSIFYDMDNFEIRIYCDGGRPIRPLFIVKNGKLLIKPHHFEQLVKERWGWRDIITRGFAEYIDISESMNAYIAFTPHEIEQDHTHCEIHNAVSMFGVSVALIPYPDHNQSPRNVYQCAMGKQAMGTYTLNYQNRMDTMAHVLCYPQKPLVTTKTMNYVGFKETPAGQNIIVAINCYTGYNQEDSIIFNQSSIDRGLFRSISYRTSKEEEKKGNLMDDEMFEIPQRNDTFKMRNVGAYKKLEEDGLVAPGMRVVENDIIIGKTTPYKDDSNPNLKKTDSSSSVRKNETGIVDEVLLTMNEDGYRFTKVKIRSERIPEIGDKFSSRHGQKGTMGMSYPEEDLPYTKDGIRPDCIINPHCIPSRMTIGQLIECLMGKKCAIKGEDEGDATPFSHLTIEEIGAELKEAGFIWHGKEDLYHGHTGKPLESQIFIGPTYYQRLKHMTEDKIHARARGPIQRMTRQPVEGRARDGGLRFGKHFAEEWCLKTLLVCVVAGNTIKFRESLKNLLIVITLFIVNDNNIRISKLYRY